MTVSVRAALVRIHRITGLLTAVFLFMSGLTGSVIAFWPELDASLNPELFRSNSVGTPMGPSELAAKVEAADPRAQVIWVSLNPAPGTVAGLFVGPRNDPATGKPFALDYNQLAVDPVTGAEIGRRMWGGCCFERRHIIPFLHTFHYTLYLPDRWGVWIMGVVAMIWFVDCFVAIGLTFPRRRPFLSRWAGSFRVERRAGAGRLLLDIHRAGGLWLWLLLATLAMSGVALNLEKEVFRPVVSFFLPLDEEPTPPKAPPGARLIGFDAAVALADRDTGRLGWGRPGAVFYDAAAGTYAVSFQRDLLDRGEGMGISALIYNGVTGALIEEHVHGRGPAGTVLLDAQFPLHSGRIAGLPGRIVVCVAGLAVAVLSVTGVLMWSRRRRAQARLRGA